MPVTCNYLYHQALSWVGTAEALVLSVCSRNAAVCDGCEGSTLPGTVSVVVLYQALSSLCAPENQLLGSALVGSIASGSSLGPARGAPEPRRWERSGSFSVGFLK